MRNIADQIENAFDLSYTDFSKYPTHTEIKNIGIIGGGTAGYLAALALQKMHPHLKVTVVESSKIPVIGVGESTTTEIVPFLHRTLGIDPVEFFLAVDPTFKFGIHFDWGQPGDYKFNFSFFVGHQQESYYYENDIANSNWPSVLMNNKKIPIIRDDEGEFISFLPSIPFSYHLDNKRLIRFLNSELRKRKIEIRDLEVTSASLNEDGSIAELQTAEGEKLKFDLYIDCTGFRSKLLSETLKTPFRSFADTLYTDRAMTFDIPNSGEIDCYTGVITMKHGWCWKIPMRNEDHYGYVFSSEYCTPEEAQSEIEEKFGKITNPKVIHFKSGRHELAWNKNVFSLGNAYGFVEPLESTAIQTAVHSINALCRLMPASLQDKINIEAINNEIAVTWDTFRWFIGIHYKFNKKYDTPFWLNARKNTNIGFAEKIVELFQTRAPLSAGSLGSNSPYTATEGLVFNSYSYDTILYGQKVLESRGHKPLMTEAEYKQKVSDYQALTKRAIGLRELLEGDELIEGGVLENLFDDPDTWISEADA